MEVYKDEEVSLNKKQRLIQSSAETHTSWWATFNGKFREVQTQPKLAAWSFAAICCHLVGSISTSSDTE